MKHIIFDCDGTLVDSEVIATEVFTAYWATHGVHMTAKEFKENFIGKGNNHPECKQIFDQMPPHAIEEGDRLWEEALENKLQPVNGMMNILSSLKVSSSVGSNSSLEHVKRSLNSTGLDKFFGEHVYSAQLVSNPKPAADLFLYIADKVGIKPKDCIVVEDSLSGIKAAQNAGMKVVAFSGASHFIPSLEERLKSTRPDFFCSSTEELSELFKNLGCC